METKRIARGLSIAGPYPALLLEPYNALLASDLHIGLEDEKESLGIHIPTTTLPKIIEAIIRPAKELGCEKVILLGDVKHEFGRPTEPEWYGVRKLVKELRSLGIGLEVVRGNHDNYIITILKEFHIPLHQPYLQLGKYLLLHGHDDLPKGVRYGHVVMGHEHPVIAIRDELGIKHRFKSFLKGVVKGRSLVVLPSVSPLAYGSDINTLEKEDLLSPVLKKADLGSLIPYALEMGEEVRRFPPLAQLP